MHILYSQSDLYLVSSNIFEHLSKSERGEVSADMNGNNRIDKSAAVLYKFIFCFADIKNYPHITRPFIIDRTR